MKKYLFSGLIVFFLVACGKSWKPLYEADQPRVVNRIMPAPSTGQGNPEAGFRYLTEGGYVGSGFPWSFARIDSSLRKDTVLYRDGANALVAWTSIAFEAENGAMVVSGSCFSCHSELLMADVVPGLGGRASDFTNVKLWQQPFFPWLVRRNATDKEWEASQNYVNWLAKSFPWIQQEQIGLNPAFRLEEGFAAHRDPVTLAFRAHKQFPNQGPNVASDVPPLWNVKKKHALYYNGMGRGNFTKLLMQAGLMGISDTVQAREIQQNFVDVVAWLESLEAPAFPGEIDQSLAQEGRTVFEANCEKCHGRYDENPAFETYPNKLVPMWEIQTDPAYAQYFLQYSGLPAWFNQSWFGQSSPHAEMLPSNGYVAPPLDGVWATAPYLHNGSVPTLADLLDSSQRPEVWSRTLPDQWDVEKMGIQVSADDSEEVVYDTRKPGQGNMGHYFGDELTDQERTALLEYLKTL